MLAYHNDIKIKNKYLARVKAHEEADEIEKGFYWEDGKGCAVGCTIHSNNHMAYERELGIPATIAYLEDRIFENLPNNKAKKWPAKFLSAIKPGADLSLVTAKFMVWLLIDEKDGVIKFIGKDFSDCRKACEKVAALYQRIIDGNKVSNAEWNEAAAQAAWAAEAAARAAARAAEAAQAAEAAEVAWAARAAARAAAQAAWAAEAAAQAVEAAWAAEAAAQAVEAAIPAAYKRMADKLIQLLKEAPVHSAPTTKF